MAAHFLTDQDVADLAEMLAAFRAGRLFPNSERIDSRRALGAVEEIAIGKTAQTISPDGSGNVTRWTITSDVFSATSPAQTIVAHDWAGQGIANDTKILLARVQHKEGTRWVNIAAQDIFVAIEAGNTTGYLKDQFDNVNVSAQYEVNKDLVIELDLTGSAPDKNLLLFSDMNSYTGTAGNLPYNAGAFALFVKNSSDALGWSTPAGHSPWIVVSAGGTFQITHGGPQNGETTTTVPSTSPSLLSGSPNAESHNWTTSPNAGAFIFTARPYQATPGGNVDIFFRTVTADTLGHSWLISAETIWANAIVMPSVTDLDEKVAVVAGQPPGYLSQVLTFWLGAATYQVNNDIPIHAEQDGDNALFFLDFSALPGYNLATAGQVIGHEGDGVVACIVFVGDGQWISVAYTASTNSWDFLHGNPKNEAASIVTLGASTPSTSTTADTGTFTANGTNSLELWLESRVVFDTVNLRFVQFVRMMKRDSKGHEYSVGAETGPHTIFDFKALPGWTSGGRIVFTANNGALQWFPTGPCEPPFPPPITAPAKVYKRMNIPSEPAPFVYPPTTPKMIPS